MCECYDGLVSMFTCLNLKFVKIPKDPYYVEMGLEPNSNRTNRTRTLVFERTQQSSNPYFTNWTRTWTEPNPKSHRTRTEPNPNNRVLSRSTPHHTNGQRNATLVNTKTSQSFPSHFTNWASASHFWIATPSRNYRYVPKCLVSVPSCAMWFPISLTILQLQENILAIL